MGGLGFKDLEEINKSLLAKVAWQIVHNPNALWVCVLRAFCFLRGNFLDSKVGGRSSWCWRSVCCGKEVIDHNSLWWVKDGANIRLWKDPWIPNEAGFKLNPHDLIDEDSIL